MNKSLLIFSFFFLSCFSNHSIAQTDSLTIVCSFYLDDEVIEPDGMEYTVIFETGQEFKGIFSNDYSLKIPYFEFSSGIIAVWQNPELLIYHEDSFCKGWSYTKSEIFYFTSRDKFSSKEIKEDSIFTNLKLADCCIDPSFDGIYYEKDAIIPLCGDSCNLVDRICATASQMRFNDHHKFGVIFFCDSTINKDLKLFERINYLLPLIEEAGVQQNEIIIFINYNPEIISREKFNWLGFIDISEFRGGLSAYKFEEVPLSSLKIRHN